MTILYNKKVKFNYHILSEYESGIVLLGSEVKSIKNKHVSIAEAFCSIRGNEIFVINMQVQPYSYASPYLQHDIQRNKKLLLKKKEILEIKTDVQQKRYALMPLSLYLKQDIIKLKICLCKSKKMFDKREELKLKSIKRDIDREMSTYIK